MYSTSNLFVLYVLYTMTCKAFHAFLELAIEEERNGSRQITVYWIEFLLCRGGCACADTCREMNEVAV